MKYNFTILIIALFISLNVQAQEKEQSTFTTKWDNGFKIESSDKNFKLKFGGRIMYDYGFFSLNDEAYSNNYTLGSKTGNEFRRARFFNSGTIYKNVDYKLQLELSGGKIILKDAYITLKNLPVGNLRIGHFKEPLRLDVLTSSKYMSFMERAFHVEIVPERNSGFMLFDDLVSKRLSWQLGVFTGVNKSTSDNSEANGDYAITSRISGLVINQENTLLHLGASYSYRKPQVSKSFGFSARPEVHMADKYIKTSVSDVDNIDLVNFEAALVAGSFAVQGEYLSTKVNAVSTETFDTYYTEFSYYLTGEKKNYKNSMSGFDRVKPKKNFGDSGLGAVEVAFRFSGVQGMEDDTMKNIAFGVNWLLNPATRIMANYIVSNIDNNTNFNGEGRFSAFQMRFQIDF